MEAINYVANLDFKDQPSGEALRGHLDDVTKEIRQQFISNPDIQIHVKDEGSSLYSVSMNVVGGGHTYHAKKVGKKVIPLVKKVKRTILRRIRQDKKQKIARKKKQYFKELRAS